MSRNVEKRAYVERSIGSVRECEARTVGEAAHEAVEVLVLALGDRSRRAHPQRLRGTSVQSCDYKNTVKWQALTRDYSKER